MDDDVRFEEFGGMRMAPLEAQVGWAEVGHAGHLVVLDVEVNHLCSPWMISASCSGVNVHGRTEEQLPAEHHCYASFHSWRLILRHKGGGLVGVLPIVAGSTPQSSRWRTSLSVTSNSMSSPPLMKKLQMAWVSEG